MVQLEKVFWYKILVLGSLQTYYSMISRSTSRIFLLLILIGIGSPSLAEDGYRLWLRYDPLQDATKCKEYASIIKYILGEKKSPTLEIAEKELKLAFTGLLGIEASASRTVL